MDRRFFLGQLLATTSVLSGLQKISFGEVANQANNKPSSQPDLLSKNTLRKYHGFNLLNYFMVHRKKPFQKEEFALIHELGFNYVRLPMDYRCWTDEKSLYKVREEDLQEIDKAIEFGKEYEIHICLNFHRAPGWTVAKPEEPMNLWEDKEALNICAYHWKIFAERYKDIPSSQLSFNLLNEPGGISAEKHKKVVGKLVETIRNVDKERPIHCDGRLWGVAPPDELVGLDIIADLHEYQPFLITHYKASWVGQWDGVPVPDYPYKEKTFMWNKEGIEKRIIKPWKELENKGVPIFVGEFGAYNQTPHKAVMNWLEDVLSIFHEAGWGWAMWNFMGTFGPINSDRSDVEYEEWKGYKVDRKMMDLLQKFAKAK